MRTLFIFAILLVSTFAHHHGHFKNKFNMKPRERKSIGHSYSEIANEVNRLKTTWTATTYKRDYTPLILIYQTVSTQEMNILTVNHSEKSEIKLTAVHAGLSVQLKL